MNELETQAGLAQTPGYRYASVVGSSLHVAGQVPHNADGELIGAGNPSAQAHVCLDNLVTLMAVHGFDIGDVQRLVVYVVGDQQTLAEAWAGVREWFDGEVPPATLLGLASLGHPDQLVEVDATILRSG